MALKNFGLILAQVKTEPTSPFMDICANLPASISSNLTSFHAFTGCDTVSAFCGIGKKKAWKTWLSYPAVNVLFHKMMHDPNAKFTDESLANVLQRFVILMYDRTSSCESVNECRRILFTKKNKAIENIPLTFDALIQHTKRAALQATIWSQCLHSTIDKYPPSNWGWKGTSSGYVPVWCTQPDVAEHCRELVACSCKHGCQGLCKCKRSGLACSQLCNCEGRCSETRENISHEVIYIEQQVEDEHEVDNELDIMFDSDATESADEIDEIDLCESETEYEVEEED